MSGLISRLMQKKLLRDSATQGVQNMLTAVLNFVQLPLFLGFVGAELFGKFVLWQAAAGLCGAILCLQFAKAVLASAPGHAEEDSIVKAHLGLGLAVEIGCVFLFSLGSLILQGGFGLQGTTAVFFALAAASNAILQPSSTLAAVIRISGNYALYSLVAVGVAVLRLMLTLVFNLHLVKIETGLAVCVIFVAPEVIRYALLALLVPRRVWKAKFDSSHLDRKLVFWGTAQNWFDIPNAYLDRFVISWVSGPETVGQYFLLRKIGMVNSMAFSPFIGSLVYEYARRLNSSGKEAAMALFRKSLLPFGVASWALVVLLLATKEYWATRVFDGNSPQDSLLIIVLCAYAFQSMFTSLHPLINAAKQMANGAKSTLIANVAFLVCCLVGAMFYGVAGVCVALFAQFVVDVMLKWRVVLQWRGNAIS
jgi:O-antigen/teichoic acid export membrane protein